MSWRYAWPPGPWRVSKVGAGFEVECDAGTVILQAQQTRPERDDRAHMERRAAAQLAALAPEMFEAINEINENLQKCGRCHGSGRDPRGETWAYVALGILGPECCTSCEGSGVRLNKPLSKGVVNLIRHIMMEAP